MPRFASGSGEFDVPNRQPPRDTLTQSQDSTRFPTLHGNLTEALKTKTELSGPLKELVDNRIKTLWPPVTV